ncbi:MAG TPA: LacI family DNA-binding transcriptional regulator [Candidatus Pelethocola excrementipullorum]|nr:LacI family DNA-binding transcriptional regulator [Candidatus Pelethocola excrementipullorum]
MKVTIRDIAKEAGVSPASVSLVLNDKPCRIADKTRERILETAKEKGYIVNRKQVKKEKVIGVLIPEGGKYFHTRCVEGICIYNSIHGYKTITCQVDETTDKCLGDIELMVSLNVQGIILIPPLDMNIGNNNERFKEALSKSKLPFLLLDHAIDRIFCDFITADNKSGAYMATEHLILAGHERIGVIAGIREVYNTRKRLEGYKEAMVFYGKSIIEENIYYGDYRGDTGYSGADYLWKRGVTAIFCMNDEMALGVYAFARDKGLTIGDDISVIGFDDTPVCKIMSPPLTSVAQPGDLMGKKAAEVLIKRIEKVDKEGFRNNYFAPQLIERKSVRIMEIETC